MEKQPQNHKSQTGTIYTCPMHPEIRQDKPGTCPKCGMNLVPVKGETGKSASTHHQEDRNPPMGHGNAMTLAGKPEQPEKANKDLNSGEPGYQKYTCPMHPHILQDAPGNCPLCGMTLIPLKKSLGIGQHESHSSGIADFKKRFYVALMLTIPIMLLSP